MRFLKACTTLSLFLLFSAHGLASDDHGDTIDTATSLGLSAAGEASGIGEIGDPGDVDVYKLPLRVGGVLTLSTSSAMDTQGELLDASGNVLNSDDDSGDNLNFEFASQLRSGTYYIRVSGYGTTTGTYTLNVRFSPFDEQSIRYDHDGDRRADILLRRGNGDWYFYAMDGRRYVRGQQGFADINSNSKWEYQGRGDFDGDGTADVLTRHIDGRWYIHFMFGRDALAALSGRANLPTDTDFQFRGIGDLNGDGKDDILLRRESNNKWFYYPMNGRVHIAAQRGVSNIFSARDWKLAGIGDLNDDGTDDILLRRTSNGAWFYFPMQGKNFIRGPHGLARLPSSRDYVFQGIGDLNGDGKDDVLLRRDSNSKWFYYPMNGKFNIRSERGLASITNNTNWELAQVGDFNADGNDDVMLRNRLTGGWYYYPMDGRRKIDGKHGSADLTKNRGWVPLR